MDIEEYNKLDDNWINEFEKTDKIFQDFYKDDIYYINLRIIYINRNNEIDKIKNESFLLTTKNCILYEEMLGILKKNSTDNETNYTLLSILKYNINLEPDEVNNYVNKYNNNHNNNYLSVIKNIDVVTFDKSINMFHDLNDIIFVFYEKSKEIKQNNQNNKTKKTYSPSFIINKKTIKKRYKD
jgi:hypothetical protein